MRCFVTDTVFRMTPPVDRIRNIAVGLIVRAGLDALRAGDPPFYPVGMAALAESLATASRP